MSSARYNKPSASNARRGSKRITRVAAHRREAGRAWHRLWEAPAATLVTVLIIAIALLLPSLLLSLQHALTGGLHELQSEASLSVYLQADTHPDSASQVSERILTMEVVADVATISPSEALAQLAIDTGLGDTLDALGSNPLPFTLVVQIDDARNGNDDLNSVVQAVASEIRGLEHVESVVVDGEWLRRLDALTNVLTRATQLLAILVAVGLLTAIGNTIRLAVEQRRDEIRVSKLIGASDSTIARPFLYTGLMLGLMGGLLTWGLQVLVVGLVSLEVGQFLALYNADAANPTVERGLNITQLGLDALILGLIGAGIGWVAAFFSCRRAIQACEP